MALAAMFMALSMSAQTHKVDVKLQDASTGEAVGFATVSLTPEKGSVKYALTDGTGAATLEKIHNGKYTFKAEIMGYVTVEKTVTVEGHTNLGVIKMELDSKVLDAASVSAVGNPIIIKKDTVEYNASSFKISDDNMLVDLLKKLPGIEVSEDGSITSNGETISKITIDGKTFFLDDPQLASSNLPAKLVEKVKVIKKKSEQAEFTGIDDGNDETIIDLTVQKSMMNGIFGNLTAGAGHDVPSANNSLNDWRFTGNGMVGRFASDSQISVIANGNNGAGGMGFSNFSGNMMSAMMGGMGGRGGGMGGMGGGFSGMGGGGITTSWMGGVNASLDLLDNKMEFASNYQYNGSNSNSLQESYKETYQADGSSLIAETNSSNLQSTYGHRVGLRIDHKFSDNTSLMIQPQFSFGGGDVLQQSVFQNWKDQMLDDNLTNNGYTNNTGKNKNLQFNGRALFRQRLGMPGRTLSLNVDWNISNNFMDGYNQSLTNTFMGELMKSSVVNQRIDQTTKQRSLGARLVYTEPLGNNFYLEGSYQVNWSYNTTDKLVYNSGEPYDYYSTQPFAINGIFMNYKTDGETYDSTYSNNVINRNLNQNIGVAFMYQDNGLRAQLGAAAIPTNQYNLTNGKEYNPGTIWNFSPRAMLFYDFTDNSNVRLFYFGRSSQPSTSQLMPVMDNSNPLSMSLGNPYLRPYFNHGMRSNFEYSLKQKFFTARLNMDGNYTQSPITNAVWYDLNGRSYSFPVNGEDTFSGNVRLMINAPIAKSKFTVSNTIRVSYSKTGSYIGRSSLDMDDYFDANSKFDYEKFHEDYFDGNNFASAWDNDFQANTTRSLGIFDRARVTYRSDNLEVILGGRTRFSKPWYTVQAQVDPTWANQVNASIKWTVNYQLGLEIGTDADYNWYNGYTTPQPSELVWNATMSMPVFKRMGTIAIKAYDILDQAKNLTVTDTENYHQEVLNNTLGRYVIVSLTMRFGNFGKAGEQMRSRMGPGRGPMGGPPRF